MLKIGKQDREMHQSKSGRQWHCGIRSHLGFDKSSDLNKSYLSGFANANILLSLALLLHWAVAKNVQTPTFRYCQEI